MNDLYHNHECKPDSESWPLNKVRAPRNRNICLQYKKKMFCFSDVRIIHKSLVMSVRRISGREVMWKNNNVLVSLDMSI